MDQTQRLARILEILEDRKQLTQEELAMIFSISKDTARRDILALTEQGLVDRIRGGISLPVMRAQIASYTDRLVNHAIDKQAIAAKAVEWIPNGATIMLDVSTTVHFISKQLTQTGLLVVTHSIDNAISVSSRHQDNKVYLLGGYFNPDSHLLYGSSIGEQLKQFYFDYAFIGASGITEDGLFYSELEDVQVKKSILQHSKKVCLVVDASKMNQTSSFKISFEGIDLLITNQHLPAAIQEKLDLYGIEVIVTSEEEHL
ncbi:DeoR/GlpR family DNA-binding transcription regulator [Paenibacillus segetis]|uniref:DeoR family transcriptional regulator n=1 Tax=Paenibacillus segetis TaxID=1325360 RepID=A0ABQ1YU08_9BACL|nr:DeoR/GlpR family DNA-binding transcription regulator [Paenibacillus segetis]GGH38730.1 DeoR family transcriptional regulator [Paenibacillus segetis]